MTLTSISNSPAIGLPGQTMSQDASVKSMLNLRGNTAQVVDFTPAAVDETDYVFTVAGIPVQYTSGVGATVAQIRDGLIAAGQAIPGVNNLVILAASGNNVRVTERDPARGEIEINDADANIARAVVTAHSNEEIIYSGRAAVRDTTADRACRTPSADGQQFEGVVGYQQVPAYDERVGYTSEAQYVSGQPVPVVHRGPVLAYVEEAVAPGDAVFFRHTANGALSQLGAFRTDDDGGNADEVANARWRTSAAAGGLAELALDTP